MEQMHTPCVSTVLEIKIYPQHQKLLLSGTNSVWSRVMIKSVQMHDTKSILQQVGQLGIAIRDVSGIFPVNEHGKHGYQINETKQSNQQHDI